MICREVEKESVKTSKAVIIMKQWIVPQLQMLFLQL